MAFRRWMCVWRVLRRDILRDGYFRYLGYGRQSAEFFIISGELLVGLDDFLGFFFGQFSLAGILLEAVRVPHIDQAFICLP